MHFVLTESLFFSAKPNMTDKLVIVSSVMSSSAELQIEQLALQERVLDQYYYVVQYKEHSEEEYMDAKAIDQNIDSRWVLVVIEGLKSSTEYVARVMPFRTHHDLTEAGWPTKIVSFTTGSAERYMVVHSYLYIDFLE
jgi:hypothetical protein